MIPSHSCTLSTCPVSEALLAHQPLMWPSVFFLTVFALTFCVQAFQLLRYPTWKYTSALMVAGILEMTGYVGRLQLHTDPFSRSAFWNNLLPSTLAPLFFIFANYKVRTHLFIFHYHYIPLRFSQKTVSLIEVFVDSAAFLLQAVGAGLVAKGENPELQRTGNHLMLVGSVVQLVNFLALVALVTDFGCAIVGDMRRKKVAAPLTIIEDKVEKVVKISIKEDGEDAERRSMHEQIHRKTSEKTMDIFLAGQSLAPILIFIRVIYQIAKLAQGFRGALATHEASYIIFDGFVPVLVSLFLTVCHPGWAFGRDWVEEGWSWKGDRSTLGSSVTS